MKYTAYLKLVIEVNKAQAIKIIKAGWSGDDLTIGQVGALMELKGIKRGEMKWS